MTCKRNIIAAASLAMMAAGCSPNDISMGASVRNNNEAQIVEPDPKYAEAQLADGSQTASAQERYRTGNVKKPKSVKTTAGGSGNGSSSSGNRN